MATGQTKRVKVFLNPLQVFGDLSAEAIVNFVCPPGVSPDVEAARKRYDEITEVQPALYGPPDDPRIMNQFVWPLRQAKASYVVGNYISTIALCAVVCEMLTLFVFQEIEFTINGAPVDSTRQRQLFGNTFDDLTQSRRLNVFRILGWVGDDVVGALDRVRGIRNRHLHIPERLDLGHMSGEARNAFKDTAFAVSKVIGQNVEEGKLIYTPLMLKYLQKAGHFDESPAEPAAQG